MSDRELRAITLIEDQPISGNSDSSDGLNLSVFAETLAGAALGSDGPLTLGVYGSWGVGKTSTLQYVKHLIEREHQRRLAHLKASQRWSGALKRLFTGAARDGEHLEIITVWYNPWHFEHEEHPLLPLLGAITAAVARRARATKFLRDLLTCLKALLSSIELSTTVLPVNASLNLDKAVTRDGALRDNLIQRNTIYPEALAQLHACAIALRNRARLIVFVDDLDRCQPSTAVRLLDGIKLALGQPGFVFFLAVDDQIIQSRLTRFYKEHLDLPAVTGDPDTPYRDLAERYLHKLVQMDFPLPGHTADRFNPYLQALIKRAFPNHTPARQDDPQTQAACEQWESDLMSILAVGAGGNPRSAIRAVNRLIVQAHLWRLSQ